MVKPPERKNMEIRLLTMKDGEVVLNKKARMGVDMHDILDEVCEIAENEVLDGYADYSRVTVDGEIYMEYES